jgi:hypothetical protein
LTVDDFDIRTLANRNGVGAFRKRGIEKHDLIINAAFDWVCHNVGKCAVVDADS